MGHRRPHVYDIVSRLAADGLILFARKMPWPALQVGAYQIITGFPIKPRRDPIHSSLGDLDLTVPAHVGFATGPEGCPDRVLPQAAPQCRREGRFKVGSRNSGCPLKPSNPAGTSTTRSPGPTKMCSCV